MTIFQVSLKIFEWFWRYGWNKVTENQILVFYYIDASFLLHWAFPHCPIVCPIICPVICLLVIYPQVIPPVIWPRSPGLNFWVLKYHNKKSIQNMTPNDISKFTYVNRSFILNTPYKKFQNSDQVNRPPIWLTCFIKISNGDLQCKWNFDTL